MSGVFGSTHSSFKSATAAASPTNDPLGQFEHLCAQPPSLDVYRALGKLCLDDELAPELVAKAFAKRCEVGCALSHASSELDIFVATWNVGNAQPLADEFESWLPQRNTYDIVAIGLQECEYKLTPEMHDEALNFIRVQDFEAAASMKHSSATLPKTASERMKDFEDGVKSAITSPAGAYLASQVLKHLGEDLFYLVGQSQLVQMRLFVFARREHRQHISQVEAASQGTGVGGVGANKGGVAVCLRYQHTRLCLISVHLAAHRQYALHRNRDCEVILGMVQRKLSSRYVSYQVKFDHVFFFGDVNSRLLGQDKLDEADDAGMSEVEKRAHNSKTDHTPHERETVISLIANEKCNELLNMDQLRQAQQKNLCLNSFVEAAYFGFPPTFKVARESGYSYNSKRLPAYCDRILYFSPPQQCASLKQIDLWSDGFGVTTSDHKPVSSVFHLEALRSERPKSSRSAGYRIVVSDVACTDLLAQDVSGTSDPYIILYSDVFDDKRGTTPIKPAARTKVKFRQLNPVYKGERLTAPVGPYTLDAMQGASVVLQVWDFDTLSHDDPMGEVLLNVDDLIEAFEKNLRFTLSERTLSKRAADAAEQRGECTFDLPVVYHGRAAGRMTGVARLVQGGRGLDLLTVNRLFGNAMCCWKVNAYVENCIV